MFVISFQPRISVKKCLNFIIKTGELNSPTCESWVDKNVFFFLYWRSDLGSRYKISTSSCLKSITIDLEIVVLGKPDIDSPGGRLPFPVQAHYSLVGRKNEIHSEDGEEARFLV